MIIIFCAEAGHLEENPHPPVLAQDQNHAQDLGLGGVLQLDVVLPSDALPLDDFPLEGGRPTDQEGGHLLEGHHHVGGHHLGDQGGVCQGKGV